MELWFTEIHTPDFTLGLRVRGTLHREKTPYQELAVLDTFEFGRMLVLDGIIQTTEKDEFVYHEMLVHVPMFTHPRPRRVMVVGGGDGGSVREILRHPAVEEVELVEIDERVIAAARQYLPTLSGALDDPRVRINVTDGIRRMAEARDFDVILVDSTDPVGPAVGLFHEDFYAAVARALAPGGVFTAQTECPWVTPQTTLKAFRGIARSFPVTRLYTAKVPTYSNWSWSFTVGSLGRDPLDEAVPGPMADRLPTRYYTAALHRAVFVLPRFVEELIKE
ncbi:MAG: polyamine aminopropyltransferase [bacterium]|nr:polyamine aminopropyltransferase [bacterium]